MFTRCCPAATKSVKVLIFFSSLPSRYHLIALGHRAAHVGDGVDEAAIHQAQAAGAELRRDGDAVGAIAVEQHGRRAIHRRLAVADQRHRDQRAVLCRGIDALDDIVGRIVTRGTRPASCAARARACACCSRTPARAWTAKNIRTAARASPTDSRSTCRARRRLRRTRLRALRPRAALAHNDAGQAVLALHAHEEVSERLDFEDQHARPVRDLDTPVLFRLARHAARRPARNPPRHCGSSGSRTVRRNRRRNSPRRARARRSSFGSCVRHHPSAESATPTWCDRSR